VAFFGTDNRYAIGKARSELGYQPAVSLRDAVRTSAEWYLRHARATASTAAGPEASQVTEGATT
jgi:dTDP-D-glucose 4,6-dehydratase